MDNLQPFVLVFLGAGLGGVLRHILNVVIGRMMGAGFPWSTAFINVTGSLAMGLLVGWLAFRAGVEWTQPVRLFAATGILGGYTTFSTFSLETILLIERHQIGAAAAYVGGSVALGVLGLWVGLSLCQVDHVSAPDKVVTLPIGEDEAGMRLDRWFRRRFPDLPQTHLNKIVRKGEVRVDGKRVEISARLEIGQSVRVPPLGVPPRAKEAPALPNLAHAQALRDMFLFEDRDLIVLNKPFGLAVQGGSGTHRHIDGMLAALADRNGERPVLVHRLDRDTSGVLLVAKSRRIAAELGATFRSRGAKKIYWALVEGVPRPEQGRISMFLAKGEGMGEARGAKGDRADIERMRVARHGDPEAQHSLTLYATIDRVTPRLALLSMRPITGRTHQLRAHCEAIGHPIIGDPKYNRRPDNDPARADPLRAVPPGVEKKLHLLARRLILPHPRGGVIDVTAPLPEHMRKSFDMFGFEPPSRDPIEDAPDE